MLPVNRLNLTILSMQKLTIHKFGRDQYDGHDQESPRKPHYKWLNLLNHSMTVRAACSFAQPVIS